MNKSNANAKRNGYIGLGAMILLAGATVFGSDPLYKAIDNSARPELYVPGTYTGTAKGYGGIVTAEVTVSGKMIDSIAVNGEKETLLDLVVPALPDSILAKQSTEVDAVSGATISSNAIKEAVDQALAKARGEEVETEEETTEETPAEALPSLKDGTYNYEAPEFDENGYKDLVTMTIKDQTITSLTWDCLKEDGSKKSQLSMDGKYVMTEDGPKWHEQAEAVVNYVLENQSLTGLVNQEGYTDAISSVSINLMGFVTGVKDCLSQASEETNESAALKDGTYNYEAPEFDENGYKDLVTMTIKDQTITSLTWDCLKEDGSKKSQLSMDGKYVMTEDGPKWHEQAEAVVNYVLENQSLTGLVNQEGYTDAISSVSINLMGFVTGVKDCLSQASEETNESAALKDGTYNYEAPEFDENGYKDLVTMTIKDQTITSLTWDCLKEDGSKKSQLSMDGKYVMTEDGPKWHEQAEAVVNYVLENQSLTGLVNQEGYTDAISSVSINLMGFVTGVKDCLSQASAETNESSALKDGTYNYEAPEFDENGYKDLVTMTIKDQAITSLTWDCLKEDGSKKSQLSMDGKYVMTEDGPKWHEQAEAVVNYVLDNQSLTGLVNQEGYTDAISSVSINLMGFVTGVKDCLSQASEETNESAALKDGTYNYEAPEFDENGYKDLVTMTIKDQTITSLTWDCLKEDGSKKSQLSMDGKYVMTEDGPKWHEQAEAVVNYVLDNQSLTGLVNQEGYTDAISSVSINLMGFVTGVKDCFNQASQE